MQLAQQNYQKLHPSVPRSGTTYSVPTSMPTPNVRISSCMSPQMLAGSTPIAFVTVDNDPKYLVVSHDAEDGNGRQDTPMLSNPPMPSSQNSSVDSQYQVPPAAVSSGSESLQSTCASTNSQVSATFQQKSIGVKSPGVTNTSEGWSTTSAAVTTATVKTAGLQSCNKVTTLFSPPAMPTIAKNRQTKPSVDDNLKLLSDSLEEMSRVRSAQSLQLKRQGRGRKLLAASQLVTGTPPNLLQASSRAKKAIKRTKKHVYKARENGALEATHQAEDVEMATTLLEFATKVSEDSDALCSTSRGKEPYCPEDPLIGLFPKDAQKDDGQNVNETFTSANKVAPRPSGTGSADVGKDAETMETSNVSRTGSDTAADKDAKTMETSNVSRTGSDTAADKDAKTMETSNVSRTGSDTAADKDAKTMETSNVSRTGSGTVADKDAETMETSNVSRTGSDTAADKDAKTMETSNVSRTGSDTAADKDAETMETSNVSRTGSGTAADKDAETMETSNISRTGSDTAADKDAKTMETSNVSRTGSDTAADKDAKTMETSNVSRTGSDTAADKDAKTMETSNVSRTGSGTVADKDAETMETSNVSRTGSDTAADKDAKTMETSNVSRTGSGTAADKDAGTIKVDLETSSVARTVSDTAAEIGQSDEREVRVSGGMPVHDSSEEGRLEVDSSPMDVSKHSDPGTPRQGGVRIDASHQGAETTASLECTMGDPAKLGAAIPGTPTPDVQAENGTLSSPKDTPTGILKHTSQFDTPFSAAKVS